MDQGSIGNLSQSVNPNKLRGIIKIRDDKARLGGSIKGNTSLELDQFLGKVNVRGGPAKLVNTLNPKLPNGGLARVASISRGDIEGLEMPRTAESPTRLSPR